MWISFALLTIFSAVWQWTSCVSAFQNKTTQTTTQSNSSLSCSSEPDAPATEDRRPHSDVQLSEVGWRAGLTSAGRAWPVHVVPPSQWPWPAESQPLYWPAGVPLFALLFSFLLLVSPLHWPRPLILSSPFSSHQLFVLFFLLRWRHGSFLRSAPPFFLLPLSGGGVQPPTCRGRCDEAETALSLGQLRVSSSARCDVLTRQEKPIITCSYSLTTPNIHHWWELHRMLVNMDISLLWWLNNPDLYCMISSVGMFPYLLVLWYFLFFNSNFKRKKNQKGKKTPLKPHRGFNS